MKLIKKLAAAVFALCFGASAFAQYITVQKDEGGWRLMDGNRQIEVKGMVWSYTPIGETYTYDLFSHSDEYIQRMIDTDMPMLKAMGVNTIRCFSTIPPEWVEYIYSKYGIYTIINDLLGRYGCSVNGTWYPATDYSDRHTRDTLIAQATATAERYRGVHGVLMYMFGNESNYGLVWSGSDIENLPTGEQDTVKAGYLYSLLEEAMAACKDTDPLRPVGFINGDTQYLELIKKLCPSLDILGVNAYRGYKFYDSFYENIAEELDKPVIFTESGADAFNAVRKQEDQYAQMMYLKGQWQEIYEQAYGKGKSQNILGGCVFEWIDEWWKHYQNKDLAVHNTEGTWSNAGYDLDYRDGVNNMDEEWFGICAQSTITDNGINRRIPRAAYYLMQNIWQLSLYDSTQDQVAKKFASLEQPMYLVRGNEESIKESINEKSLVRVDSIKTSVETTTYMDMDKVKAAADSGNFKNGLDSDTAAESSIALSTHPFEGFDATAVVKVFTAQPYTHLGDKWGCYYTDDDNVNTSILKYADLYSASFQYDTSWFTMNGYYHIGHGSFETTGDVFNISTEAYDIIGYDTNGSKAPIAVSITGKQLFEGLTVIGGPEVWGYAKPQILANYWHSFPSSSVKIPWVNVGAVYSEGLGQSENVAKNPYNGYGAGRKASLYAEGILDPWVTLKLGALTSGSEKIGASYITAGGKVQKITMADTLGGYAQLGTNMFQHMYIYANAIYRGLVADTNPAIVRGSFYTGDSGSGNRFEMQAGVDAVYGDFVFKPVFRARVPLQASAGRSLLNGSPFIVGLGNRQSIEVEGVLTYDPEGATWFHDWNSVDIEGAKFAMSLTGLYQLYAGKTDVIPFRSSTPNTASASGSAYYVWYDGLALPVQKNLFTVGTRIITNPLAGLRVVATAEYGHEGSTGDSDTIIDYWKTGLTVRYNHWVLKGSYWSNAWGPEYWWRTFNKTFPQQWTVDLAYGFSSTPSLLEATDRVGIKLAGRTFSSNSADPYGALSTTAIAGKTYMEVTTYVNIGL